MKYKDRWLFWKVEGGLIAAGLTLLTVMVKVLFRKKP